MILPSGLFQPSGQAWNPHSSLHGELQAPGETRLQSGLSNIATQASVVPGTQCQVRPGGPPRSPSPGPHPPPAVFPLCLGRLCPPCPPLPPPHVTPLPPPPPSSSSSEHLLCSRTCTVLPLFLVSSLSPLPGKLSLLPTRLQLPG